MSAKTSPSNRIDIGLALFVVFLLVFATNRLDKRHFNTVQDSLTTVYNDRVVAQDYVYKMSNVMSKKHLKILDASLSYSQSNLNEEFIDLMDKFSTTKFTSKESLTFEDLNKNFNALMQLESKSTALIDKDRQVQFIDAIKTDLNNLSLIQVSESKYKVGLAQRSLDTKDLMSTLEIVFLVIIGFTVQFALFYRVKKSMTRENN